MVVPDATLDERFYDNPLVTGPANLRFYAGVPLTSSAGHALGALCIIDGEPHHDFSSDDCERLRELAKMAADRLELRRVEISTEKAGRTLEIFDTNPSTAFVRFDKRREVVARNAAAAALYGYKPDEGFARSFDTLVPERERAVLHDLIARAIGAGSVEGLSVPAKLHGLRRDETEFDLGLYLTCFRKKGDLTFNAHLQDLTALRLEEEELHRLANTDILTTVANRAHFYRQAEKALAGPSSSAVLMIDLDGFKDINDTLGPAVGDGVLCEVARRLEALAGPNDTVARFGGDEFAILLTGLSSAALAHDVARAAIISVAQPIFIAGHEVRVTAGCGIAVAPLHGQEAVELIGNADLALSKAKSIGRGNSFVFVTALRKEAMTRRLFNMELHRALSDDEFVLVYQPQTRLADGALTGAEALIRWLHPKHGLLAPAAFLPALEGGSLAAAVGSWILDEACAQAALWRRSGAPDFRIGVNLFGAQFRTNDLASEVFSTLERHGLPPEALELEVTENIGLDHNVLETLQRLRDCGVGIAFDDFGTGYASLSLLKRYPLSRIKIDRCFVQSMLESERDASVIRAILYMARSFDLETTAEGVETEEQRESLRRLGCEEGQGFLFSRPLPAPQFADTFGIGMPRRMAARA
ncbi:response regulator receiver modulated diguanylate cyclase/phosphodiesterase [Caballeronia choica]|uniref:Response regulator receiver modulated diguanylate cyclase/phosphodiesterase n=2 Tax=Caballeronia choica TaxID=326476 RepID=A0A158L264_9BURK|nr:response regulator receiver modulated diguanylate cyclase/phosphodiesterase [Caballeronia choica]